MHRRTFLTAAASFAILRPTLSLAGDDVVRIRDLYEKDLSFSELARASEGKRITLSGFMAPPLKSESKFFVLTNRPMAVCPFCETEADWPLDIVAIYTKRIIEIVPFNVHIAARGELELGTYEDPEFGFVSRVRLVDTSYDRA